MIRASLRMAAIGILAGIPLTQQGHSQTVGEMTPSPEQARVYFVDIRSGQAIPVGTVIHFGLSRMGVAPAGTEKAGTGHHHLLIDGAAKSPPPMDQPIPSDDEHIHFGSGQTEYQLRLPPGKHTLRLVLGDAGHVPHGPPVMSKAIEITVVSEKTKTSSKAVTPKKRPKRAKQS